MFWFPCLNHGVGFRPRRARPAGSLLEAGDTSFSKGAYSAAIKNYGKFIGMPDAALAARKYDATVQESGE